MLSIGGEEGVVWLEVAEMMPDGHRRVEQSHIVSFHVHSENVRNIVLQFYAHKRLQTNNGWNVRNMCCYSIIMAR